MSRVVGVGGIGPESTIDYYRSLLARYRERTGGPNNPPVVIYSIDIQRTLDGISSGDLGGVTSYFISAVKSLAAAGAEFALLAANTPHVVFPQVSAGSPIPLLSIVEAVCAEARTRALGRLAIVGTRFTMEGRFYPEVFEGQGVTLVVPERQERSWIHTIYVNELLQGLFLPETRAGLLKIFETLREREGIDGVILAGTELPLILRQDSHSGIPLLDTTAIHVESAVSRMLAAD